MSDVTSYHYATTIEQVSASGYFTWADIENGKAEDAANASVVCTASSKSGALNSNSLVWTNFNFISDLPEDIVIDGIEATQGHHASAVDVIGDRSVYLRYNSVIQGSNMLSAPTWPASPTNLTYGSSNNLWGMTTSTLTRAMIIDPSFGLSHAVAGAGTAYINYFKMRVYYSPVSYNTAVSKESRWKNVWDAKVATNGQMIPLTTGWIVIDGIWQKWWPPPKT